MKYKGDLKNELGLDKAMEMAKSGVDVFNARDGFFNDICHENNNNGIDITIDDRRADIYKNVSFCDNGCSYKGMNYDLMIANCACDTSIIENNNENNNKIKNNFIDNIHLKIIKKKNSSNFIRSINEEEEESFTVKRQFKSPNPIKINNIDLKQNNKYKLTLNEVFTNINNAGRKEKNLNKKSNSFFSNHILNNLKIKNDGDLYEKNLNSKIPQFDLINFNTINERNLNYDNNKKNNFTKLKINGDKNKLTFDKTINQNLINSNHNLINNNIILKNSGKHLQNKSKERKIMLNLKCFIS
jgi:hypothetical protein